VRHPNVVSTLDVVAESDELLIVMDYVEGESLAHLMRLCRDRSELPPVAVCAGIVVQALHGLHAAHEAKSESGMALGIVHRDVSPQNILVGADGVVRVVDFGIARAFGRSQQTRTGVVKGKVAYMSPEQLRSQGVDRRLDVYAASVVLWEILSCRRLFASEDPQETIDRILNVGMVVPPSSIRGEVPTALDVVLQQAASRSPDQRYATALDFADAIEQATPIASGRAIAKWMASLKSTSPPTESTGSIPSIRRDVSTSPAGIPSPVTSRPESAEAPPIEHTRSIPGRSMGELPRTPAGPLPEREATATHTVPTVGPVSEPLDQPKRRWVVAALAGAAVAVVAGISIWRSTAAETRRDASARTTSNELEETAVVAPSASSPVPSALVVPAPAVSDATATASASSTSSAAAPMKSAIEGPKTGPVRTNRCSPPYYYENGLKRFKPGCL
jgi:serine/threonine protein kinase